MGMDYQMFVKLRLESKQFFFEKKNQKTFGHGCASVGKVRDSLFSSEKETFVDYTMEYAPCA
jgi:hypothetical protein